MAGRASRPGYRSDAAPRITRAIRLGAEDSDAPLHFRIYRRIRGLIISGALPPGARLPASRALAAELGVSRNSVTTAMEHLTADGWVESRRGSGVYVADEPPAGAGYSRPALAAPAPETPFNIGVPGLDLFPLDVWNRLQSRRWRRMPRSALREGDGAGWPGLRDAIAAHLAISRGFRCAPEQVIVTTSIRAGVNLAVRALGLSGCEALVEEPGYFGSKEVLRANGIRLAPAPVDEDGMDVGLGVDAAPNARLAIVTPACQFPSCTRLSGERRAQLLAWARDRDAWVFEEDYDWESDPSGGLPPLAASAPDRTVYFNSFSRMLFPALRIAYLVAPEHLIDRVAAARGALDGHSNVPNQMVLADFINSGPLDDHMRRCRVAYAERREALTAILARDAADWLRPLDRPAGLHLVCDLMQGEEADFTALCAARGVGVQPMQRFRETPATGPQIMLGFSGYTVPALNQAGRRLSALLAAQAASPTRIG